MALSEGLLGWKGVRTAQRTQLQSCFESLCCAPVFAQKPCLSSRKRSGHSVQRAWLEKYADIAALAKNATNVSESVSVRVSVCERECVCV